MRVANTAGSACHTRPVGELQSRAACSPLRMRVTTLLTLDPTYGATLFCALVRLAVREYRENLESFDKDRTNGDVELLICGLCGL